MFAGGARDLHPLRGLIAHGPYSQSLGVPTRVRLAFLATQSDLPKLDRIAKELTQSFKPKEAPNYYVLYKLPSTSKYTKFEIPKKAGGVRQITAPIDALKGMQRALVDLLNECRAEIAVARPRRPVAHGYREGLSIITNAQNHKARRYVLNLDLADFFPTFNFGRVRGFFLKDEDFALDPKTATIIAQIACFENSLPQGSPS